MPFHSYDWLPSALGTVWALTGLLPESTISLPAISAAHLATPLVQHTSAKGVPGLAREGGRVDANRGAFS